MGLSLVLLTTVVGCGQLNTGHVGNTMTISNQTVSNQQHTNLWIEFSSTSQGPHHYSVTTTDVSKIGDEISKTNLATNGPSSWSSSDGVIAVYRISGVNISKAVAAKLKDGSFVRADFVGNKKP